MTDFDQFWALYPRKSAKKDAEKAWKQLSPSAELYEALMVALTWQRVSPQWLQAGGQFVPYAATWLRGERWNDEIPRQQMHQPCPRCGSVPKCQSYAECNTRLFPTRTIATCVTCGHALDGLGGMCSKEWCRCVCRGTGVPEAPRS